MILNHKLVMSEELIISISGMRGIVGENLTAGVAADYGCAFGTFLKSRFAGKKGRLSVCIGRDSRPSGQMLKSTLTNSLLSVGIDVVDIGLVTTPGVGIMLRELSCEGGVVITASHNPIQYNGIKLLLENGIAPAAGQAEEVRNLYFSKSFALADSAHCGKVTSNEQTDAIHIAKVLKLIDKESVRAGKFRVVLDSVNGAGGRVGKKLLSELGCEVIAINDEPTGLFAHAPEPTAKNLTGLCSEVKKHKAQTGFAQDPDADRLAIVDENGIYIGEEYTLALATKYIFSKNSGRAATNLSTSRMTDDIARKRGCEVIRTPVGEANVAEAMIKNNCIIGGEGNGGVIDLRVGPIRDSQVAMALVLQLMADSGKTISQLAGELPNYCMKKEKIFADKSQAQSIIAASQKIFADAKVNTSDGCRFDFDDGWVHIRSSNTEPVMGIIAEAVDEPTAGKYIKAVLDIHKEKVG